MRARGLWRLAVVPAWVPPAFMFAFTFMGAGAAPQQELLDGLLRFQPSQAGVDYEKPTDKAVLAGCKVTVENDAAGQPAAYVVKDSQGKMLRRFANLSGKLDARKKPALEQFSYFQDGFEVYRETDSNGDRKIDECRWLNGGGTRIVTLKHGTTPQGKEAVEYAWKRISAEEASKVMVLALVSGDLPMLESLMATPEELTALGLPRPVVDQADAARKAREARVVALRKGLVGWDPHTVWSRFDGIIPHSIPAEASSDLKGDVLLYENAVIFPSLPNGTVDPMKAAYLHVPELIRIGETWKFVGLPLAIDPSKPAAPTSSEGIRAALFRERSPEALAGRDPALVEAEKKLAEYDAKSLPDVNPAEPRTVLKYHHGRLGLLREILRAAGRPEDQLLYNKQVVDDLTTCYQTGLYAEGAKAIDEMARLGGKIGSYAAFRKILAENAMDDGAVDPQAHQKAYIARLQQFLTDHAKSEEAPDALLQLAMNHEFKAEEDEARKYYAQLGRDFPDSEPGKKARGALRRLDLVGKPLVLKGTGLKGEAVDLAAYKGKTVAVIFWHSGYDGVRKELPEFAKVAEKHKDKGLVILGVNLDGGDRAALDAFLKSSALSWPQIVEPQGMDGQLADDFGILAVPTIFLVDSQGKVANRTIRMAIELDRLLEKPVAARTPDDATGVR